MWYVVSENKREHFRLNYTPQDRPRIDVGGIVGAVFDISESGIRFGFPSTFSTSVGQNLIATVTFKDGKTFEIEGRVVRTDSKHNWCALTLSKGFPLGKIMEEQRLRINRSKKWDG